MKTLRLNAILVSTLLTTCQLWAADGDRGRGGESGGGGGAVKCSDGKMYSLDYLLTQPLASDEQFPPEITQAKNEKEILLAIAENLKQKIPNLGKELETFANGLYLRTSPDQRYWSPSKHPLLSIDDQIIIKNLNEKCSPEVDPKTKKIIISQAVVRTPDSLFNVSTGVNKKGKQVNIYSVQYSFDQNVLSALQKSSPIQASFLLLHEFLRDFTDNVLVIYKVTRFLHHSFHLDDVELYNSLIVLGLPSKTFLERRFFDLERHALYTTWVKYRDSLTKIQDEFMNFIESRVLVSLQDLTEKTFQLQKEFNPGTAAALKGKIIGLVSLYSEKQKEAKSAYEIALKNRPADFPGVFEFYTDSAQEKSHYFEMYEQIRDPRFLIDKHYRYYNYVMRSDSTGITSDKISEISSRSLGNRECLRQGLLEPTFCYINSLLFTIQELEKENTPKTPEKKSSYFPWSR